MNSRIENESGGKYLYIETTAERDGFESKMAESVISENIITPNLVYAYGGMCLEYNITGLIELNEYLSGLKLNSRDIIRLIVQIEQCVNTIKNYLLSEADLLLDTEYVYADTVSGALKLCIVPGYNGDFESELKMFISKLLVHIDEENEAALRLGFKLFRAVSQDDCKLHDVTAVLKYSGAETTAHHAYASDNYASDSCNIASHNTGSRNTGSHNTGSRNADSCSTASAHTWSRANTISAKLSEADAEHSGLFEPNTAYTEPDFNIPHESVYGGMGAKNEQNELPTEYDDYLDEEEAPRQRGLLKETLTGLLVSQVILVGVAVAVFLLKGRTSVMRLIPVYLVIAVCLTVYYVISFIMKRRRAE